MELKQKLSPNYGSRQGWIPDMVVYHITEGRYSGSVAWLCNPQSGASAHFVVSRAGEVTQLVPLKYAAWANGLKTSQYAKSALQTVRDRKVNPNLYTVSVEFEGIYEETHGALTAAQIKAGRELTRYIKDEIRTLYGREAVEFAGHCMINPQGKPHCPGESFPYSLMTAVPLSLDTRNYTFPNIGAVYDLLVRCEEKPVVISSNPQSASAAFLKQDSRGYIYRLTSTGKGRSNISVRAGEQTELCPVSTGILLDTAYKALKVGEQYDFLCKTVDKPEVKADPWGIVHTEYVREDSRGHLFRITGLKAGGTTVTAKLNGETADFPVSVKG